MLIVNGKYSEEEKIYFDSGVSFGRGVFETIQVKQKPLFIKEHVDRMNRGLETLGISTNVDADYIVKLVAEHSIENCVMKIIATEKNLLIATRQNSYTAEHYSRGFKVKLSAQRRNPYSTTAYIKSLNYTDNLLEREKALSEGFDEVIFLNTNDCTAEGTASNIFFVKDEKIYTPSIDCGVLDGIVRAWIVKNFHITEGAFSLDDLKSSSEIFITNSILGVMKVSSFDGVNYNTGKVTEYIRSKYEEHINSY
jgi:4-amino-4-deoxychorismate lyase